MASKMISKSIKNLLIGTALIAIAQNASAFGREGKTYTKIDLGYGYETIKRDVTGDVTTSVKTNNRGLAAALGTGYYLLDELRIGVDLLYTNKFKGNDKKNASIQTKSDVKTLGAFAEMYYDILTGSKFNPYVNLGYGIMRTEVNDTYTVSGVTGKGSAKAKTKAGYKAGLGVAYHINTSVDLDIGYTMFKQNSSSKNKTNAITSTAPAVNSSFKPNSLQMLMVGIRYTF